jgi:fatty aldehyde-generating acyl-ACP reductase
MDRQAPGLDFAVIGHQDSWENIQSLINVMRTEALEALPVEKIKGIYSYIPPRAVFKMHVESPLGPSVNGVYIDSFIPPDHLDAAHLRSNIQKVREALGVAHRLGARMAILGGFTSILLEGNFEDFSSYGMVLTTGNTLTSSYVVKGIEKAARIHGTDLEASEVLIIGATGDIGSACARYLKGKVRKLLLCARNQKRLGMFAEKISTGGQEVRWSTNLDELTPDADLIISVASSSNIPVDRLKKSVVICDAGYPKNLEDRLDGDEAVHLFHGGMGHLTNGYVFDPDYTSDFYRYPFPHLGHGCIIEVILMALEGISHNYSFGKGNIRPESIDEMYALSLKHGIELAPFYNSEGIWPSTKKTQRYE